MGTVIENAVSSSVHTNEYELGWGDLPSELEIGRVYWFLVSTWLEECVDGRATFEERLCLPVRTVVRQKRLLEHKRLPRAERI